MRDERDKIKFQIKLLSLVVFLLLFIFNKNTVFGQTTCDYLCGTNAGCLSTCKTEILNNINNGSNALSNAQLMNINNNYTPTTALANTEVSVNAPPSAYSHTHLYNGYWNFIPPHILFHPTKVIGDSSMFCQCRLINVTTNIRHSFKDRFFGVFDERAYVLSGVGRVSGATFAGPTVASEFMIVCGLNTQLPPGCVSFIGSGHIFMENYATTEGALVSLAQMGASKGANVIGNVTCAYAESVQSFGSGLGLGGSYTGPAEDGVGALSLGGSWSTGITKRPSQPFCTGDFYVATLEGCFQGNGLAHAPAPRPYRRYLPANNLPPVSQRQYIPQSETPVRGLW